MGIISFLGNKEFYFIPYQLTGHSGITWFLALSEGEIIDNKYTVFNSINYFDITTAAASAGISGILSNLSAGLSVLTEGVVVNPALAKVEYDIESPTEWGLTDGLIPEDFKKGSLTTFNGLSDWGKWVVLSNNLIDEIGDDAKQADEDYSFLNSNNMLNIVRIENQNFSNSVFISQRIDRTFNKFKEKETISEVEQEFFSNYSIYSNDKTLVSEIRTKIIKQTGDSNFIAKEFGIENFFTLENFVERVSSKIKKEIDEGANNNSFYKFEKIKNGISYDVVKIDKETGEEESYTETAIFDPSPSISEHLLRLETFGKGGYGFRSGPNALGRVTIDAAKQKNQSWEILKERAGFSGDNPTGGFEEISYSDLKKSNIYENPVKYEQFLPYKYDSDTRNRFINIYPFELKRFYDPNQKGFLSGWRNFKQIFGSTSTEDYPGLYDVLIGQYIKFAQTIEYDAKDGFLDKSIGTHFNNNVDEIYPYVMAWVVVQYENLVRYNLAKLLEKETKENLEDPKLDALATAERAADLNLQGMEGDLLDEELTEEDIQQRVKFYKQCALLLNMDNLNKDYISIVKARKTSRNSMHQTSFYNNRFYMVNSKDDNLTIKNKLISPSGKKIKPFMEITPDIASALKPRLRLYKVYKDGDKTVSFEFPFPSYVDGNRATTFNGQEIDRGDGIGIKSFNFSFDGETPATSQQYISADLQLFFQTFSDFVKERNVPNGRSDGQEEKFRYADLFVNTKFCPRDISKASPLNYDPQYYRLRVDIGWEPRNDDGFKEILKNRGLSPTLFNQAILAMNKSFYLNLIDHEINISDSGTVTISANYIAYIEGLMENNNVLLSPEAKQLEDEFVDKYEKELKKQNCDTDELAEIRASINALRITSRNILHQSLISKLVKSKCVYYTQIESQDRKDFARRNFFSKKPSLISTDQVKYRSISFTNGTTDILDLARQVTNSKKTTTENYNYIMDKFRTDPKQNSMERISFFYMSDLVYYLLDSLYIDGEPEEQVKIILSSFSVNIPFTGDVEVNIGQIPIEIEVFTKWYKQEIVDKELDSISFLEFIKRLTFYLITDIFSEICIDDQQHKRLSFMNAAINSVKDGGKGTMERLLKAEPVIDVSTPYSSGTLPLVTSALNQEKLSPTDFVQYLLIYPHHRPETHVGRARAIEDANRGVHHLYIGANKGILKNASFSKTDIQYLRESRMLTQGENGLLQLSSLYRANLKLIGNTIFYPGMLLYLNPFGFGGMDFGLPHQGPGTTEDPNLANIMGIGGYQKVVKVSSSISESGKFETDVECIFEHTGEPPREDATNPENSPGQRTGRGQQNIRKITCKDLDKVDANAPECTASDVSKDLQNKLLQLNRQGNIDSVEQENE